MINQQNLWLIGGTSESRELATAIIRLNLSCVVTVTTEEAIPLYPQHPCLTVVITRLSREIAAEFVINNNIKGIIDASHPYASEISQLAIHCATIYQLPYLRYERPILLGQNIIEVESLHTILTDYYLLGKRVLLTIGYQGLKFLENWHDKATLYARILPKIDSLQAALNAGFSPKQLIAFRPPLDYEMEKALWQHWKIETVVSKASGQVGGEDIKRQISQELKIPLILIQRPSLSYPQQTSDLEQIKIFCQQIRHLVEKNS
ncbi:MAG: cobalt-precorrin-6A reductase [Microcystaceae cyanobacterium]